MPNSKMEDEPEFKLPKETPLPARLEAVVEKSFPYKIKTGPNAGDDAVFTKWEWEFLITDGEYAGLKAWGESEAKLTNHPDNKVRQWAETLMDTQFEIGQGLDTDDLLALPCVIVVDNEVVEREGKDLFYKCPVIDVFPVGTELDPPF